MTAASLMPMNRSVGGKLAVLVVVTLSAPAAACTLAYCAQRLAPADQQILPANARALIAMGQEEERRDPMSGATSVWRPWINRVDPDGGVRQLLALSPELQPTGPYGNATLFDPGAMTPGAHFRLESSADCSSPTSGPAAEVLVVDAAPLPSAMGTMSSPPSARMPDDFCGPGPGFISKDLYLELDDSVRPWVSVARVNLEVNGKAHSTDYGRLARGVDGGSQVFVERLTRNCSDPLTGQPSDTLQTWLVKLELEIPGFAERPPPIAFAAEMDCRPSCASVGAGPWLIGALALAARCRLRRRR